MPDDIDGVKTVLGYEIRDVIGGKVQIDDLARGAAVKTGQAIIDHGAVGGRQRLKAGKNQNGRQCPRHRDDDTVCAGDPVGFIEQRIGGGRRGGGAGRQHQQQPNPTDHTSEKWCRSTRMPRSVRAASKSLWGGVASNGSRTLRPDFRTALARTEKSSRVSSRM